MPATVVIHTGGTNVTVDWEIGDGDADAIFAEADLVVSERFHEHRHGATPLETRGLLAEVGEDGRLTVWGPAKVKHFNLTAVASVLGLAPERVRFIEPDVGGAFGARGELYPEDYLIPWAAMKLGRPVKWIEDRAESLIALNQSREQTIDLEVAASADGQLLAFRARNLCNMGAYLRTNGIVPPMLCAMSLHGPYRWRGFRARAIGVLTNKTPLGTFRGPGEVEATFARERMLDLVAARTSIDPVELRRRNLIPAAELPYVVSFGSAEEDVLRFGTGDYHSQLDTVLEHAGYADAKSRRSEDPDELIGVGVACSTSESGVGAFEWARVVAERDGTFSAFSGIASVGQGLRTALAQVLADEFAVPLERAVIRHHDTDEVEAGEGAFGDRGMIFGAGAILLAVADLRDNARRLAAARLGVEADAVEIVGDRAVAGDASVSLGELDASGVGRYEPGGPTHLSFCAAVAQVSVDRATGKVTLRRYTGGYDAGARRQPARARRSVHRRGRPGHRRRAVRGVGLRRIGTAARGDLHGLRPAYDGRAARDRVARVRVSGARQPAGRQGRRERRDHLHARGGGERRRRCARPGRRTGRLAPAARERGACADPRRRDGRNEAPAVRVHSGRVARPRTRRAGRAWRGSQGARRRAEPDPADGLQARGPLAPRRRQRALRAPLRPPR